MNQVTSREEAMDQWKALRDSVHRVAEKVDESKWAYFRGEFGAERRLLWHLNRLEIEKQIFAEFTECETVKKFLPLD